MSGNSFGQAVDGSYEFALYDSLPAEIRQALRECVEQVSAEQMHQMVRKHGIQSVLNAFPAWNERFTDIHWLRMHRYFEQGIDYQTPIKGVDA